MTFQFNVITLVIIGLPFMLSSLGGILSVSTNWFYLILGILHFATSTWKGDGSLLPPFEGPPILFITKCFIQTSRSMLLVPNLVSLSMIPHL